MINFDYLINHIKSLAFDQAKLSSGGISMTVQSLSSAVRLFRKEKVELSTIQQEHVVKEAVTSFIKRHKFFRRSSLIAKKSPKKASKKKVWYRTPEVTFDSEIDGIYIITSGSCRVVNRCDNYEVCQIMRGDFWGEAEAVNICDYSYYGDIYAATDVKINFISFQDFESIPLHEIETVCLNILNRHDLIHYTLSKRYGVNVESFKNILEGATYQ